MARTHVHHTGVHSTVSSDINENDKIMCYVYLYISCAARHTGAVAFGHVRDTGAVSGVAVGRRLGLFYLHSYKRTGDRRLPVRKRRG